MIFKLKFSDGRTDWAQAKSLSDLFCSYECEYDDFDELEEVAKVSDDEAKVINVGNMDYDEDDALSEPEITTLYDLVDGDDFAILASTMF